MDFVRCGFCTLIALAVIMQDTEMPTINPDGCEEKCSDPVLVGVVKKHHGWITKVRYSGVY